VHGGMGYMRGSVVEQFFRDVRLLRIFEGASDVQRLLIAREMMR